MWVKDEERGRYDEHGRYKALAYFGLVVLSTAFGYAVGADRAESTSPVKTMYSPTGLQTFGMLTEAAEAARQEGDAKAAVHLEEAASAQRTRLLAWAAREQAAVARLQASAE